VSFNVNYFRPSSTDKADILIIVQRTRIGRHDDESDKRNGSNRLDKPKIFSRALDSRESTVRFTNYKNPVKRDSVRLY